MMTPRSILHAIEMGIWDYEPDPNDPRWADPVEFAATKALPGTREKLAILSRRLEAGLPLWHPQDRHTYDEEDKKE